ncbi:hypothetical protein H0H92_012778 [Tricholoma furcatifolium]|nr:hypothetical protein H0H92_012778 [Tricholoma furcatifolium]
MSGLFTSERPIDTPSQSNYFKAVQSFLQDEPLSYKRVLELVRDWKAEENDAYNNISRDVVKISTILKKRPILVRDLNAVLPRGFTVLCPITDVAEVGYFVFITSSGGQIFSTSADGVKVPYPSSTLDLRVSLPLKGAYKGQRFILISPWIENGNLRDYLKTHPEHDRLKACFEISSGLDYLHRLIPPIFHHDIKAVGSSSNWKHMGVADDKDVLYQANILITNDGQCCLADFGLSSIDGSQRLQSKSYAGEGTSRWQPPEVVLSDLHDMESHSKLNPAAIDVYAFGCTVLEVFTGNHPFANLKKDIAFIRALERKQTPELPDAEALGISDESRSLFCLCWDAAPAARPTMRQINTRLKAELDSRASDASGVASSEAQQVDEEENGFSGSELGEDTTVWSPQNDRPAVQLVTPKKDEHHQNTSGLNNRAPHSSSSTFTTNYHGGLLTPPPKGNDTPPTPTLTTSLSWGAGQEKDATVTESEATASTRPAPQVVFSSRTLTPETPTRSGHASLFDQNITVPLNLRSKPSLFAQGLAGDNVTPSKDPSFRQWNLDAQAPAFEPSFLRRRPGSSAVASKNATPVPVQHDAPLSNYVVEDSDSAGFSPLRSFEFEGAFPGAREPAEADILTPPETPFRAPMSRIHSDVGDGDAPPPFPSPVSVSPSSPGLSPKAQPFVPRSTSLAIGANLKASAAHRLNVNADVFMPSFEAGTPRPVTSTVHRQGQSRLDALAVEFKPSDRREDLSYVTSSPSG